MRTEDGFSLLEALLASAALALIGVLVIVSFSRSATFSAHVDQRYFRAELGRSVIEEYLATYPEGAQSGTFGAHWVWEISEQVRAPIEPTRLDEVISVVDVTVSVYRDEVRQQKTTLHQSVVRRK